MYVFPDVVVSTGVWDLKKNNCAHISKVAQLWEGKLQVNNPPGSVTLSERL